MVLEYCGALFFYQGEHYPRWEMAAATSNKLLTYMISDANENDPIDETKQQ